MMDIWEFANPQAIALGVGVAVLLSARSLESIVLWKAMHQSQYKLWNESVNKGPLHLIQGSRNPIGHSRTF